MEIGEREREGREGEVKGRRDDEFHETLKCKSIPLFCCHVLQCIWAKSKRHKVMEGTSICAS